MNTQSNPVRSNFNYDIDTDIDRYRQWCKKNYTYRNEPRLK